MSLYRVESLTDYTIFTTPPDQRRKATWAASWSTTIKDLERELDHLGGHDVVLELDILPGKIRRDGLPMADAKVRHPGVRMSFQTDLGAMSFTCDRWLPDWRANVRSIVLTLDRLRAVDRYGATRGEQYAGFKAIGAGTGATPLGGMTGDRAAEILYEHAHIHPDEEWDLHALYRRARAQTHPDRAGDRAAWDQVEQAGRVLGLDA